MGFNFPNSPVPGQLYTPVGGYQYVFLDGVWRLVEPTQAYVPTALARNRFVNPAFQISQENGESLGTANGYFPADQWMISTAGLTGAASFYSYAIAAKWPTRLRATCAVAQATVSTGYLNLLQRIEGARIADFSWGSSGPKSAVLRLIFSTTLAGTYSVSIRNNPITDSFVASFTVAADEINTNLEKIIPIPPPPSGAWAVDNTIGLTVSITLAAGQGIGVPGWQASDKVAVPGQVNFLSSTSNVFYLFAVGLYLDPDNTSVPPPWETPDLTEEWLVCMRYWQKGRTEFSGNVTSGSNYYSRAPLSPVMRVNPSTSGISVAASAFAATAGVFAPISHTVGEVRPATATAAGRYVSDFISSARM
jgi:hypothetical protein